MEGGREEQYSVGKRAWRACRRNPRLLLAMGLFHFTSRVLVIRILALCTWISQNDWPEFWRYGLFSFGAVLYIFWLLPARFAMGERMRRMAVGKKAPEARKGYALLFKAGLMKLGRGILWGLPFLIGLSLFLYGMEYLPYNDLGKILQKFVLFGEATSARGLIAVLLLLLLLLLAFAFGWRRDMAMEYLPVRKLGLKGMRQLTGKTRQRGRGKLLKNTCANFLFTVPAVAGCALVLLPYAQENMRSSSNMLRTVQSLLQLMKEPLPNIQLLWLAAVAAVLYMPFFLYRKMRNAVLVQELTREWDDGEDGHAA
ncbi:MAG: hypothetical protein E7329_10265 [Clostridiales bacterium]|nr:hypothetical protein [Clostridiales bacterium]